MGGLILIVSVRLLRCFIQRLDLPVFRASGGQSAPMMPAVLVGNGSHASAVLDEANLVQELPKAVGQFGTPPVA